MPGLEPLFPGFYRSFQHTIEQRPKEAEKRRGNCLSTAKRWENIEEGESPSMPLAHFPCFARFARVGTDMM